MASTYRPKDAFDYAKHYVKEQALEKVGYRLLDDVQKIMWMAAPWRWSIGSMPTFNLTAATQDYTITLPGDFLYLVDAYVTDGLTAPRYLKVEATLPTTGELTGQPNHLAIIGSTIARVLPVPGSVQNTPTVVSLYKRISPVITNTNLTNAGVQVFDDEWFWVYQEGVLWRAYQYADDNRAGSAQTSSKDGESTVSYSGQFAVFMAALEKMKQNEPLIKLGSQREGLE